MDVNLDVMMASLLADLRVKDAQRDAGWEKK